LYLHFTTTLFILVSNIFIFLIVKEKTKDKFVSFISAMLFLTFASLSVSGIASSSLEHFQLPFLLSAYYFIFVKSKIYPGLIFLSFAVMIKQNVALVLLALLKILIKYWIFAVLLFVLWLSISLLFFDDFIFNILVFPSKYYVSSINIKFFGFYNYFLKNGYGFNLILLIAFIFSINTFYSKYKNEFIFIALLIISIFSTPMYPQHFVVLGPFLIIIVSLSIKQILDKSSNYIIVGSSALLLVFNLLLQYKTYQYTRTDGILTNQSIIGKLNGNKNGTEGLYEFLAENKHEKMYFYPVLIPEAYILNDIKTIDKLYSNDHFDIIVKNKFLRNKLLYSIRSSKPTYLVKMKNSEFDIFVNDIIIKEYYQSEQFGDIIIFKRKISL
jgi:hypothetical protein